MTTAEIKQHARRAVERYRRVKYQRRLEALKEAVRKEAK